ncbi:hypothetical protein CC80DRAFT_106211 [Byssothecium circinans]|uniref:Uncharacterized protein n=1 Tax=Byssothecium circinans TaxID=147558 RepID=A0A6A5UE05_9PLEO|nr:hypothetical protein CC80DRAFT_106211 [Byssothecium circinans]
MVLSIAMDGMLIGLMFLKNPLVYIQYQPVTYLVKPNIEMSMASLITHVARGSPDNDMYCTSTASSTRRPESRTAASTSSCRSPGRPMSDGPANRSSWPRSRSSRATPGIIAGRRTVASTAIRKSMSWWRLWTRTIRARRISGMW